MLMFSKRVYKRCLALLVSGLLAGTGLAIPDDKATVDVVESEWEGEVTLTIPMILLGDVNGDGTVSSADYIIIKNYIMGKSRLVDAPLKGADVNKSNGVNSADYVMIKNYIMGKNNISQS